MDKNLYQEIWKDIPEYEGLYQVSNMGRVKSLKYNRSGKEKILKFGKTKNGYLYVNLYKDGKVKHYDIHRLVASTFIPNPDNLSEVNHKDENKENNHVDNLEFCNHTYNINYGTCKKRISKAHKGKHHTEETKQKMSVLKKGQPQYKHRKPILQYTLDNVFVRDWDSAKSVSKELNIYANAITSCCRGQQKTAYGFIWKYKI